MTYFVQHTVNAAVVAAVPDLMMTSLLASFDLDWGSSLRALFEVAAAVSGGVLLSFSSCVLILLSAGIAPSHVLRF